MTEWAEDASGAVLCADCITGCPRPAHWAACDVDGCQCHCREIPDCIRRALADDGMHDAARCPDCDQRRRDEVRALVRERFGTPRRDAA